MRLGAAQLFVPDLAGFKDPAVSGYIAGMQALFPVLSVERKKNLDEQYEKFLTEIHEIGQKEGPDKNKGLTSSYFIIPSKHSGSYAVQAVDSS